MLKNALYNQFSKDLLNLYCKVKHPLLEEAFIRFAKDESFSQWLRHNKKEISSKIVDASVFDAFDILIDLQGMTFGDDPAAKGTSDSLARLLKRFQYSSRSLKTIPTIVTFSTLLDDPILNDILEPFRQNISFISNWLGKGEQNKTGMEKLRQEKDRAQIVEDLKTIHNMFSTQEYEEQERPQAHFRKPSIIQQRKDMAVYLLTRFSEEIASAFENSGMHEIASKVRAKALALTSDGGVGSLIKTKSLSFYQITTVKNLVDYVWKHPDIKWGNYNHDLLEVTLLNVAGEISTEDFAKIKSEHEKSQDVMNLFESSEESLGGMDALGKITIDKKMNPAYLQMLSLFFYYYKNKLKV